MTGTCNLVDLLLFYTLERVLFNRMVHSIGQTALKVKQAIALWLMLEEIGCHDLIRTIHSFDNATIKTIFCETLECLECIMPNSAPPKEIDESPIFLGLLEEPINRRFFYYNREFVYKRYVHIIETVCNKIFGDTMAVEVDESGVKPIVRSLEEGSIVKVSPEICTPGPGTSSGPNGAYFQTSQASKRFNLIQASMFDPGSTLEDSRMMFLTFSIGHPLSREEIINFFTSNWGEVVEDVYIERTRPGQEPQFGRVVFTSSSVVPKILNGQAKAKFVVNRKHLWARVYVPRHNGKNRTIN